MKREYKIIDGKFYDENGELVDDPYEDYQTKKDFQLVIEDGNKRWYLNDKLHREDGPATEKYYSDNYGDKDWYIHGKFHREDGPAREYADGSKEWWINGERHREDGPAIERANGYKAWYKNGELHRVDGPACENDWGYKAWYKHGKRHREDGPAFEGGSVECGNGRKEWWINGKRINRIIYWLKYRK